MTEEIINALTGIEELRVASRTSSFAFKGKDTDVRQIGREPRRAHRPRGQRAPGRPAAADHGAAHRRRRTATTSGRSATTARCRTSSPCRTRSRCAIAAALKVRLLPAQEASLVAPATTDVEAYNRYLKGRYFFNQRRRREGDRGVRGGDRARPELRARPTPASPTPTAPGDSTAASRRRRPPRRPAPPCPGARSSSPIPRTCTSRSASSTTTTAGTWSARRSTCAAPSSSPRSPRRGTRGWPASCRRSAAPTRRWRSGGGPWSSSPSRPTIYVNAAWAHFFARRYPEAIDGMRIAVDVDPRGGVRALGARNGLPGGGPARRSGRRSREARRPDRTRDAMGPGAARQRLTPPAATRTPRELLAELDARVAAGVRSAAPPRLRRRRPLGETATSRSRCSRRACEERNALFWSWPPRRRRSSMPCGPDPRFQAIRRRNPAGLKVAGGKG